MTLLDEAIEEAGLIWLKERDGEPCSLRRLRFVQTCREMLGLPPVPNKINHEQPEEPTHIDS